MGVVLKETVKGSIFQYLGMILGGLNVAFLFPKYLGEFNWGVLSIIISIMTLSSQLTVVGGPNIVLKYFPRYKNISEQTGFVKFVLQLAFIGIFSFIIFFTFFHKYILIGYDSYWASNFWIIGAICFLVMFNTLFSLFCSFISIALKSSVTFFFREFLLRLFHTIFIGVYLLFDLSFIEFTLLFTLGYLLTFLSSVFYVFRHKIISFKDLKEKKNNLEVKSYFTYGFFTILSGFGSMFVFNIDILMIGALLSSGEELSGKYKTAVYFAMLITIPLRPLFKILYAVVSNYWKDDKIEDIKKIYIQSVNIGLVVSGASLLFILINITWMSDFIFTSVQGTFYIILFFGIGQLVNSATGINGTIINLSDQYKFNTYSIVALIFFNFLLNYFFILNYGVIGAAIATGVSLSLFNILKLIYLQKILNFNPFSKQLLFIFFSLVLFYSITIIMYENHLLSVLNACILSALALVFYGGVIWKSKDFNVVKKSFFKSKYKLI